MQVTMTKKKTETPVKEEPKRWSTPKGHPPAWQTASGWSPGKEYELAPWGHALQPFDGDGNATFCTCCGSKKLEKDGTVIGYGGKLNDWKAIAKAYGYHPDYYSYKSKELVDQEFEARWAKTFNWMDTTAVLTAPVDLETLWDMAYNDHEGSPRSKGLVEGLELIDKDMGVVSFAWIDS